MKNAKAQTILITGAADRIGAGIARTLAGHGYNIIIHCHHSVKKAEALAADLTKKFAIETAVVQADLNDAAARVDLMKQAKNAFVGLHGLINNAAVFDIEHDNIDGLDDALWQQHLQTNTHAPFHLSQLFAKQLPKTVPAGNQACIINLLDQRVLNLSGHFLSYTVSKAALATLTQTLALALSPRIRVNGIAPGMILPARDQSLVHFRKRVESNPLRTGGTVQNIAATALFLLCTPSITGQIIAVDGGEHLVKKVF